MPDGEPQVGPHVGVEEARRGAVHLDQRAHVVDRHHALHDAREGRLEAIPLGGQHLDQLAAPGEQGVERLDRLVGQRPGLRSYPLGKEREDPGVDGVSLGELAGRLGKGSYLAGIDDHQREPHRGQRGHEGRFVATGGFEHDQGGRERLTVGDELADPLLGVGDAAGLAAGQAGELELGLRDINADELHSTPPEITARVGPPLQDAGALAHATVRALSEGSGATPRLTNGLEDPRRNELSHPRY